MARGAAASGGSPRGRGAAAWRTTADRRAARQRAADALKRGFDRAQRVAAEAVRRLARADEFWHHAAGRSADNVALREAVARPALTALVEGQGATHEATLRRNVALHAEALPSPAAPAAEWRWAQRGRRLGAARAGTAPTVASLLAVGPPGPPAGPPPDGAEEAFRGHIWDAKVVEGYVLRVGIGAGRVRLPGAPEPLADLAHAGAVRGAEAATALANGQKRDAREGLAAVQDRLTLLEQSSCLERINALEQSLLYATAREKGSREADVRTLQNQFGGEALAREARHGTVKELLAAEKAARDAQHKLVLDSVSNLVGREALAREALHGTVKELLAEEKAAREAQHDLGQGISRKRVDAIEQHFLDALAREQGIREADVRELQLDQCKFRKYIDELEQHLREGLTHEQGIREADVRELKGLVETEVADQGEMFGSVKELFAVEMAAREAQGVHIQHIHCSVKNLIAEERKAREAHQVSFEERLRKFSACKASQWSWR